MFAVGPFINSGGASRQKGKNKFILESQGVGKYGRCLAVIKVDDINVNQQLIEEGHATAYFGGKR